MAYTLGSVAFVLTLLAGAYVVGMAVLTKLAVLQPTTAGPALHLLAVPTGIGCECVLLFILAACGGLTPQAIGVGFVVTLLLAGYALAGIARGGAWTGLGPALRRWVAGRGLLWAAVAVAASAGFLLAMSAPLEWDELAYHLPYARIYATAGGLEVSDSLRFPLQAHNYHLLYAAALLFSSEAATHLIHAFSGIFIAAGIIVYGRQAFGLATGLLAALMFLLTAGHLFDTAYVDFGVALFVFFAFFSFALWQRHGNPGFLLVAAFLLAMAVGTKYQALSQLPGFALALALALLLNRGPTQASTPATRRSGLWLAVRAVAVFVVFGCFWYVRNAWISGDPLHPLGADVFGFWLWDAGDLAGQRADVARYHHHLPIELIPALLFPLLRRRLKPEELSLVVIGLAGLVTWYLTSRYDRYLLATYPFLALLSAATVFTAVARLLPARARAALQNFDGGNLPKAVRILAFALFASVLIRAVANSWDTVCFTRACVDRVYAARLASYAATRSVPGFGELKLYQFGLENERYILGDRVWGDWFGPYRYRPIIAAGSDAVAVRQELLRMGLDSILVNRRREPFNVLGANGSLAPAFDKLYEDDNVALYRIAGG